MPELERSWKLDGLCTQVDSDLMYPGAEGMSQRGPESREAAKLRQKCPVIRQCLAYAMEHDEQYGVWGGMNRSQRRALARQYPEDTDWWRVLEVAA